MDFFDRHKALIITSLIFLILLLLMYNIQVSSNNRRVRETLIELNNLKTEPAPEVEDRKEPSPKKPSRERDLQTHQAFDQNEEPKENVDSRLQEIFRKNAAARPQASEQNKKASEGNYIIPAQKKKPQKGSAGNNDSEQTSATRWSLRNSTIAFSLIGRDAIDIPNPVYTCDTPGKIVVNIEVNASGEVIASSYNEGASNTTNACLIEQALEYAARARFTPGAGNQPGTITYYFQD